MEDEGWGSDQAGGSDQGMPFDTPLLMWSRGIDGFPVRTLSLTSSTGICLRKIQQGKGGPHFS
jgi:hypothetical protein